MWKKITSLESIISFIQQLWQFKGWIMTILATGGGIGFLTFFQTKLGVAIACGSIFIVLCFSALFLVVTIKNLKQKNANDPNEKIKSIFNYLSKEDIAFLLNGKFIDDRTFVYNRPKDLNAKGQNFAGWACTLFNALSYSKKTQVTVVAPRNCKATLRFEFCYEYASIDASNIVIYIYDCDGVEKALSGKINDVEVILTDNSAVNFSVGYKTVNSFDKLDNVSLMIHVISWKK